MDTAPYIGQRVSLKDEEGSANNGLVLHNDLLNRTSKVHTDLGDRKVEDWDNLEPEATVPSPFTANSDTKDEEE